MATGYTQPRENGHKFWLPIRAKITLPYLILALLLAAGATYVINRIVFDSLDERFTNQLIESGKLAAEWMVGEENARLESVRLLSNIVGVSEALTDENAEELRRLTFNIAANQQEDLVDYISRRGILVLSMRRTVDGSATEYDFVGGGGEEYLTLGFIQRVLLERDVSRGEKTAGLARMPWGDYFLIAGPVYASDGSLSGVILVGKSLKRLAEGIRQSNLSQVSLYDQQGQLLISTLDQAQAITPEKAIAILDTQNRYSLFREFSFSNIDYKEIFGPWEAHYFEDLGIIGSALPKTFLLRTSAITRANIMALVFLTLFLVIVIGVILANYITEPLFGLLSASQLVARGNLQVQVPVSSTDEIAMLTESFNHMVSSLFRSKRDLVDAYDRTIEGWVKALEMRDEETEGHSERVIDYTLELSRRLGVPIESYDDIRRGVLLHDIGKMVIPDDILFKPGPLTAGEREVIYKHPEYAYQMLADIDYLRPALDIPLYHHERWDGSGYPNGLRGSAIPLPARIFAVADVFDAMTNDRRYRKRLPHHYVIEHIRSNSGILFDPQVVQAFLELEYPESSQE